MHTGNVSRVVTDLVVSGAVGDYALKWERTMTTRYRTTVAASLGDGGSWRYNYQWSIVSGTKNNVINFTINYPNGKEIEFRKNNAGETFWRCYDVSTGLTPPPLAGVPDRVGADTAGGASHYILYLEDGGRVYFSNIGTASIPVWQASKVVDPHGLATLLAYGSNPKELVQVTEPAGRTLQISWITWQAGTQGYSERVISQVASSDNQSVVYTYGVYTSPAPESYVYSIMTTADYGDGTAAHYTFQSANRTDGHGRPLPLSCDDPRYQGPMTRIQYSYTIDDNIYGLVNTEKSLATGTTIVTYERLGGGQRRETWGDGRLRTITYDRYRLSSAPDFAAKSTTYTYTAGNFLASSTDALNHTTTYERETSIGAITKVIYADNTYSRTVYSDAAYPYFAAEHYDELNRKTQYTRDARNNITRIDYPDGAYETWTYNAFNQAITHRQRNGSTESFTFDVRGLKTTWTDALSKTTAYAYDAHDRLASVTDPLNHATQYSYNIRGLCTGITYADNTSISFTYDSYGNQISRIDELGHTWAETYDEYNRVVTLKDPLNRVTSYSFGLLGGSGCASCHTDADLTRLTLPSGKYETRAYDANHRLTSVTKGAGTPEAATTSYEYDDAGNLTKVIDPRQKQTLSTYDARNRCLSVKDALNHQDILTYDAVGNLLTHKRANNKQTAYEYDAMNRRTKVTDALGQITGTAYDAAGNVQSITDGRNNIHSLTYDLRDRRTSMIYPGGSHEDWSYDAAGRVSTYTTRAGQMQTFSYDARDRQTQANWNDDTPDISQTYDVAGRLLTLNNDVCNLTYTYDNANQMLSETSEVATENAFSTTVAYTYNADGNRVTMTDPEGETVTYAYTARNQVESITAGGPPPLASFTYDLAGNCIDKDLENGTNAHYAYDDANRLISVDNNWVGTPFSRFDYGYNAVNNRTYVKYDGGYGDLYGYDAVDELTAVRKNVIYPESASLTPPTQTFAYDAVGNRQMATNSGVSTSYTSNNLNQYTQVAGVSQTHDANGNWEGAEFANFTHSYDAQNRLVSVTENNIGSSSIGSSSRSHDYTFAYDALNRCVLRAVSNRTITGQSRVQWTLLCYDGWNLVAEYSRSNIFDDFSFNARYVHGPMIDEILAKVTTAGPVYYHQDALGSTVNLTDAGPQVVESYSYDEFGQPTIKDENGSTVINSQYGNRFLFTGREWLTDINLYDYRNRIYSSELGRFLQNDPLRLDGDGANMYLYVANSPVSWIDPNGLSMRPAYPKDCCEIDSNPEAIYEALRRLRRLRRDVDAANNDAKNNTNYKAVLQGDCNAAHKFLDLLEKCYGPYPADVQALINAARIRIAKACDEEPPSNPQGVPIPKPAPRPTPTPVPQPGMPWYEKMPAVRIPVPEPNLLWPPSWFRRGK